MYDKCCFILLGVYTVVAHFHSVTKLDSMNVNDKYPLNNEFINSINSLNTTWRAGNNFHPSLGSNFLKTLAGTYDSTKCNKVVESRVVTKVIRNLPNEFDSRLHWPNCPTIREIRDQGSCGSCWAIAAVETMSDRVCVHSSERNHFHFSVENLMTCCDFCGHGCHGGCHKLAWKYWVEHGIVSGGSFGSKEGCQPYEIAPCEHYENGSRPNCTKYGPTPFCVLDCQPLYRVSYFDDVHFGETWYSVTNSEEAIKTEIYTNGPVEASMITYEDFYVYKSGVYQHVKGSHVGSHAVKLIGWGIDEGTCYWLVANSFNTDWGDHGYFKIKRGTNECGIENDVTAGIPS